MITSYELPDILEQQIPEITEINRTLKPLLQVFLAINNFADITGKAIREHHYLLVGRCFSLAERFYNDGDRIIRNLIRHFLYQKCLLLCPGWIQKGCLSNH